MKFCRCLWCRYSDWLEEFSTGEKAIFIALLLLIGLVSAIYVWGQR